MGTEDGRLFAALVRNCPKQVVMVLNPADRFNRGSDGLIQKSKGPITTGTLRPWHELFNSEVVIKARASRENFTHFFIVQKSCGIVATSSCCASIRGGGIMATYTKFNSFLEAAFEKAHNLGSDTIKVLLTLTAPVAGNSVKADLTEIAAGNGYSAGGATVTITSSAQSSGTYKIVGSDVVFTASGGAIANFRYAVLYNDTAASDELIGFWDYGSTVTVNTGETFTVDLDATNGIFQAA
jgi:hypothetical protein